MENRVLTEHFLLIKTRSLLVAAMFFATGCSINKELNIPVTKGIPANAILVSDQLYMVPMSEDVSDCTLYRAFSPTGSVVAAMFYKTADGKFVSDKRKSECQ